MVIADRLVELNALVLSQGSHESFEEGVCVMEAAAYIAGEAHSDHPKCVSPCITAFMTNWNDALPSDEERDRLLKPLLPLLIGTRTTLEDESTRAYLAADWQVRVSTPGWLDLAGLHDHAAGLRNLPAIETLDDAVASRDRIAAAWAAAGDAAGAAAGAAAWAAAGAAARAAAGDAAGDALAPTVAGLQDRAADLVRRMCAVGGT
jgi:hypothetical protein